MEIEKSGATGPSGEFSGKVVVKTGEDDSPKGDGPGGGQGPGSQELIEMVLAFLGGGGAGGPGPASEEPPPKEPAAQPPAAPPPAA